MLDQFTPQARRVLAMAQEEARDTGCEKVGAEHLLLGILRDGDGPAAAVLVGFGLDLAAVRQAVLHRLNPPG